MGAGVGIGVRIRVEVGVVGQEQTDLGTASFWFWLRLALLHTGHEVNEENMSKLNEQQLDVAHAYGVQRESD